MPMRRHWLRGAGSAIVTDLGTPGAEALVTEGGVNALAMICRAPCKPGTTLVTTDPT